MRVAVTGATGFLGWHVRCALLRFGHEAVAVDRSAFNEDRRLAAALEDVDGVVHTAGINRSHDTDEIAQGNPLLAERLTSTLDRLGISPTIVYTNSTKSESGGVYGDAKQAAADHLESWSARSGALVVDLVLPHLFGEFGRPDYNSAVTTFAHNLAVGRASEVHRAGELELVHAQDVASSILELLCSTATGRHRFDGRKVSVGEVFDLLNRQHERYVGDGTVPDFNDRFELQVFNTLRSQLFATDGYPIDLTLHRDDRGGFAELARADGVGQTSISTTVPGVTRGDHYHVDKIERFVVVGGQARIRLRRLLTDDVRVFDVSGDAPVAIDMPPLTTHNITNTGDSVMTTVFWAGDHFDPDHPDTFAESVEVGA